MSKTYILGFSYLVRHLILFGKADASMMQPYAVVSSKRSGNWLEENNDTHVNITARPTKCIGLYGLR